jgi:hypothetical protein
MRAAELRRRAGVYRPVRSSCVASADGSLTMINGQCSCQWVGVPAASASRGLSPGRTGHR